MRLMRRLAGALAVGVLNIIGRLPIKISLALGSLLLPLYVPFRFRTRAKLRDLHPPVSAFTYYRMRLRLALLSVQHALGRPDGCETKVEQGGFFADVLSSGKPVLLFGWHQGPVELLHRIPALTAKDRARFVMTSTAFSPVLAEWMARGRQRTGVTVIRPGETSALRDWTRSHGILAVMVDQVPGAPEEFLSLRGGTVRIPWPGRFVAWAMTRDPEILVVSTRVTDEGIVFRYDRISSEALKDSVKDAVGKLMDAALSKAPGQYNWSYGKIRAR